MREEEYLYHNLKMSNELIHNNKKKVLAYQIRTDNLTQSFLRMIDTKLVDPALFNANEIYHADEIFVKVKPEIYEKYLAIVAGNSNITLRSLERSIENG